MNWKLIVPLGLAGIVPPLATTLLPLDPALAMPVALALWTLLAAALWVPATIRAREPAFVTLLLVGVVAGVAAGLVDVAFTGDPMLLGIALVVGAVWGALFGGIAHLVQRRRAVSGRTPS